MMTVGRDMQAAGLSLRWLLDGIAQVPVGTECVIGGLRLDSRQVCPGDLFLACVGRRTRGHDYIAQALAQGAAAVAYEVSEGETGRLEGPFGGAPLVPVVDLSQRVGVIAKRFYREPSRALLVWGVTGTNGKTSCSHFLAQALDAPGRPCGVIGTLGSGLLRRLVPGSHTTPDAVTVHAQLAAFREAGATAAVMEASSHALDQGRVNGVAFDGAVFTNLSRDHLDYHGDLASYGATKRLLFHRPGLRFAVVNGDDACGREILATLRPEVEAMSYGLGASAAEGIPHLHGQLKGQSIAGLDLYVRAPWGEGTVSSPLLGRFNALNLLAVLGALLMSGVPFAEAAARLERLRPVPGRMECFGGQGAPLVVVDYAHTPDALAQVLTALRPHCSGVLWCVFGCGGDRDRGKRPLMGDLAGRLADRLILTDDNPRSEDPAEIIAEILQGVSQREGVEVIHDRAAAIARAIIAAGSKDLVVVAGKGHETEQVVGDTRRPFSDRQVVQAALRGAS